jgi:hypothetical protein
MVAALLRVEPGHKASGSLRRLDRLAAIVAPLDLVAAARLDAHAGSKKGIYSSSSALSNSSAVAGRIGSGGLPGDRVNVEFTGASPTRW